jgi:4-hydroxy-tetrahydrodipicolinate synthase
MLPRGVFPVMLTAFHEDASIDWNGVDALTDWYLATGVAGLFAVCQSSEMYRLSDEERLALAKHIVRHVGGRAPVVAVGTFGGSLEAQAAFIRQMADTGVDAVVIVTSQIVAPDEDDNTFRERMLRLLDLTGNVPLGIYECPLPYKRLLTPELLGELARTGRFLFHKDTTLSAELASQKAAATRGTSLGFYDAVALTLPDTLAAGGAGYTGIAANFYPHILVHLCNALLDNSRDRERLYDFVALTATTTEHKYPASAKHFLQRLGLPITTTCRVETRPLDNHDFMVLDELCRIVEAGLFGP